MTCSVLDTYTIEYEKIKRSRKLKWLLDRGTVELELQLKDGNLHTFIVNPLCASILFLFQEQGISNKLLITILSLKYTKS